MRYLFKYAGIISVAVSLSLLGFLKTRVKKNGINRLKIISAGLGKADDLLKFGETSREKILAVCFGSDLKQTLDNLPGRRSAGDRLSVLIGEFVSDFGKGDTVAEHRRIARLKHEVDGAIESEESEYADFSKIWQTAGVCAGFALGIMLI